MKDKEISFVKKKVKYNNSEIVVFLLLLAIAVTAFSIGLTNYVDFNSSTINLGNRNLVTNGEVRIRGKLLVGTGTVEIDGDGMGVIGGVRVEKGSIVTEKGEPIEFPETIALTGDLRFNEGNNYVGFDAPSNLSETQIYKLPLTDGTDGQLLKTDGSGNLSFTTPDGDISSVIAGTGLSGGGDSGDVTLSIDNTVATLAGSQILTNKNISLENNTLTGTTAEFNTALSDGSFATLNGSETLTNKTLTSPVINNGVCGSAVLNDVTFGTATSTTIATSSSIKSYVDSVAAGLDLKTSCVAATTGPGDLNNDFKNTDIIDGVTLATGDRILIKDQTDAIQNGIYTVNASGAPTRALDLDTGSDASGAFTFVQQGSTNADIGFVCTNDQNNALVGTNSLSFTQFSAGGGGDVSAANDFGAANRLIRSADANKGISGSLVTVSDSGMCFPANYDLILDNVGNNKIYSDGTDVHIDSGGGDINMDLGNDGGDVVLPQNTGIRFGGGARIIETDNGEINTLRMSAPTDILIDGGNNGVFMTNGVLKIGYGNNAGSLTRSGNTNTVPLIIKQGAEVQLSKYIASLKVVDTFAGKLNEHRVVVESENGTDAETVQIKAPAGGILISSGKDINLTATDDVIIPTNVGLIFDTTGDEKIESDGSRLFITSNGVSFAMPTADGTSGQFLQTNGDGVLSFGSASGGGGDVTAANDFGAANRLIRSADANKGISGSLVTVSDSGMCVPVDFDIILDNIGNEKIFYRDFTDINLRRKGLNIKSEDNVNIDVGPNKDVIIHGGGLRLGTEAASGHIIDDAGAGVMNIEAGRVDMLSPNGVFVKHPDRNDGRITFGGNGQVGVQRVSVGGGINTETYLSRGTPDFTSQLKFTKNTSNAIAPEVILKLLENANKPEQRILVENTNGTGATAIEVKAPDGGIEISSATTTAGIIKLKPGEGGLITNRGVQTITDSSTDATAAQYVAGFIECTGGGANTWTLPTGPVLADAMPGDAPTKGDSFICHVVNSSGGDITYEGATGATLSSSGAGTLIQKSGSLAKLEFIFTDATGGSEAYFCLLIADNS